MADIPGLIEKASEGAGLGFEFLKHLSRARVLLHVLDIMPADGSNPVDNYLTIEKELEKFDDNLFQKPRILAINKVDLVAEEEREKSVKQLLKDISYKGKSFNISALNGLGCKPLVFGLAELIEQVNNEE